MDVILGRKSREEKRKKEQRTKEEIKRREEADLFAVFDAGRIERERERSRERNRGKEDQTENILLN